ncbi:MAG: cell wall hydrolase [Vallitalea sp.]|jgi:N-acetylmuramoyl-L-alanine amidase|nr:cell wall hydrolase [Vallitalea sp.]
MFKVKNLLRDIFSSIKHLSKKAYTNGLVIITGCMVLAVLYLGVNGFIGTHTNINSVSALEDDMEEEMDISDENSIEDEENVDQLNLETFVCVGNIKELLVTKQESINQGQQISDTSNIAFKAMKEPEESSEKKELHTASYKAKEKESNLVSLSAKDYEALTKIVEAEATNEDLIGKILIVNVVMNRVKSSNFPNNIYDVVHQKINGRAQFSPIDDGRYYKLKVSNSTKKAVERAFNNEDYSQGAMYFVARSLASSNAVSWFDKNLTKVYQHGVHEFFK